MSDSAVYYDANGESVIHVYVCDDKCRVSRWEFSTLPSGAWVADEVKHHYVVNEGLQS